MGFDTFNVGPELEYFLFEDDKGTETIDEGGYFAMTAQDAATEVRNDTIHALEAVGIPIEYHHHEVGPSQHEIDMRYADALAMADYTVTYRLIVKEVAAWHGYYATFMPKPLFGENGSGMHTHMSLFKGGRNQFFDRRDEHHLSKVAKSFIAGLLVHAREMSARARAVGELVQAARTRATRRRCTSPGRSATARRSSGSRSTSRAPSRRRVPRSAVPIPPATRTSRSRRCSTRGSRGSRRATSSRIRWSGTSTGSPRPSGASRGSSSLPESLGEAIDELAGSDLMERALGEHIFPRYIELKRREWDEYRVQVTEWEKEKYLAAL